MFLSEGKIRTTFLRGCTGMTFAPLNASRPMPNPGDDAETVVPEYLNCTSGSWRRFGHTEWLEGEVHHSGFTTAWTPNKITRAIVGAVKLDDVDIISNREQNGGPTFAAVTARSYHPGGTYVAMGDGSVRFTTDTVNGDVWRAMGTINGND
jgi:prepilin-type processing-associated H-X9-DG protein